jgi:hypothetical protein
MESLTRDGYYPIAAQSIKQITDLRIEGKEHAKRRPASLLRVVVPVGVRNVAVEIKPTILSSPEGWKTNGMATFKAVDLSGLGRGNKGWIKDDGKVRIASWFVRSRNAKEKNAYFSEAIWVALQTVEADPMALITMQSGNCGVCGKALSDEVSKSRGVGPECFKLWDKFKGAIQTEETQSGLIKVPANVFASRVERSLPQSFVTFYSRG